MGPWLVVGRFFYGVTRRVYDLVSAEQRQVTRDQLEVVELPLRYGVPSDSDNLFLPRIIVPDDATQVAIASPDEADEKTDISYDDVPPPPSGGDCEQQVFATVMEELLAEWEKRYGLLPVAA